MLLKGRASVEACGSTLKQHCWNATCLRKVYNRPGDGLELAIYDEFELKKPFSFCDLRKKNSALQGLSTLLPAVNAYR